MKYLIKTITDYVVNNAFSMDDEALFAINGFESLEVYESLCQSITQRIKEIDSRHVAQFLRGVDHWHACHESSKAESGQFALRRTEDIARRGG